MFQPGNARRLAIAGIAACLLLAVGTVWAQSYPDTFSVNYYSNNSSTSHPSGYDQQVRIVNPGAYAPSYPPSYICAMIYVFDNDQEMKDCCACNISSNGLAELSVSKNLTINPYNGVVSNDGDIKIVSALQNGYLTVQPVTGPPVTSNAPCDPSGGGRTGTGGYALNIVPTPDLRAWSTHLPGFKTSDGRVTEDQFQDSTLGKAELDSLQEQCTNIVENGSGTGICTGPYPNSSTVCDFTTAP
jgi:hypothetical protein